MGTLEKFDPTAAVNNWMAKKNRRPKSNVKARHQAWFNGVFEDANNVEEKPYKPIIKF